MTRESDFDRLSLEIMDWEGPIHPQASDPEKSRAKPKKESMEQMNLGLTKNSERGKYTINVPAQSSHIRSLGLMIRRRSNVPFRRR